MDVFDPATRSRVMSRIRGKNTSPELLVRRFCHRAGLRFKLHVKTLPGCPDLVFPRYKSVVFVHGCFWHQHDNCHVGRLPKSNSEFWSNKLLGNRARDLRNESILISLGWQVIVVWECSLQDTVLAHVVEAIRANSTAQAPTHMS